MRFLSRIIFCLQKILLHISYFGCQIFVKTDKKLWVVGVVEIANCLNHIAAALPKSYTVNLAHNKFYKINAYNFSLSDLPPKLVLYISFFVGPILLGYLANKSNQFFYIWNSGFLINGFDGREYEFRFLKNKQKKIVNFFCGSDIRSPRLSYEHGMSIGYETMISNLELVRPGFINEEREKFFEMIANVTDTYADYIFNAPVDQISYLKREVLPFRYFYPDHLFIKNDKKFDDLSVIKIFHAPSSPNIKGTQLVRAAIKALKMQGYKFEYIEILNAGNEVILETLKHVHIVVNELYAFVPGVFGVEAMASHCALLTSADASIETSLPPGSENAWFLTRYWDVTEKIKYLLDHPEEIKKYADNGYQWSYDHCRSSVSQGYISEVLEQDL